MRSYDDVEAALFASDPPHYHENKPVNRKKPKYAAKDPDSRLEVPPEGPYCA